MESLEKAFPGKLLHSFFIRSYSLEKALDSVSGLNRQSDGDLDMQRLREIAEEAPVIEFVANLFALALDQRASDVHIEPGRGHMEIRFRIDGILYTARLSLTAGSLKWSVPWRSSTTLRKK